MTRRQLLSAGTLGVTGGAGCGRRRTDVREPSRPRSRPRPVRLVVTAPIIRECVEEVAGDMAEVTSLLAPGVPLSQLVRSGPTESLVVSAEAVVVLGLGFDTAMDASVEKARRDGVPICLLEPAFPRELVFPSTDPARPDPHVWLDPGLWLLATHPVEEMLSRLRPEWAGEFAKRGRAARFRIEELGNDLRGLAAVVPESTRHLVTRNAPLRYLGRAARMLVEVGDPGPEHPATDPVESLALDTLQAPAEKVIIRGHAHDLSTLEGLVSHALDTMLLRVT